MSNKLTSDWQELDRLLSYSKKVGKKVSDRHIEVYGENAFFRNDRTLRYTWDFWLLEWRKTDKPIIFCTENDMPDSFSRVPEAQFFVPFSDTASLYVNTNNKNIGLQLDTGLLKRGHDDIAQWIHHGAAKHHAMTARQHPEKTKPLLCKMAVSMTPWLNLKRSKSNE